MSKFSKIDRIQLESLIIDGKTSQEMANELEITLSQLYYLCQKYNVILPNSSRALRERITKEILIELYYNQNMTIYQISKKFKVSNSTISDYLKKYDINKKNRYKIDLSNRQINNWLVLERLPKYSKHDWKCKCICGNIKNIRTSDIKKIKSCGCIKRVYSKKPRKDLTGVKINGITILKFEKIDNKHRAIWTCECHCGKIFSAAGSTIRSHKKLSCGCKKYHKYKGYEDISGRYFTNLRRNAINRGLSFELTPKDIWNQFINQDQRCALSGVNLQFERNYSIQHKNQTASVDRKDSKKGYTKDNIQIVHKDVNNMKMSLKLEEFLFFCEKISNYQFEKNNGIFC